MNTYGRKSLVLCALLSLVGSRHVYTQIESVPPKPLLLDIDVATFMSGKSDSPFLRVELYQGIRRMGLNHLGSAPHLVAHFTVETMVLDSHGSTIFQLRTSDQDTVADESDIGANQQFVYVHPVLLAPASYRFVTKLTDESNGQSARRSLPFTVKRFSSDSLALSDIQLARAIEKLPGGTSALDKHGLRVTPNPQGRFGEGLEQLTFYAELYNLSRRGQAGTYHVDYIIENENGEFLHRLPGKARRKAGLSTALHAAFDISSLSSGNYRLRLTASDDDASTQASSVKPFTVFRESEYLAQPAAQQESVYRQLDDAAVHSYFDKIKYIATQEEAKVFQQLDLTGKQKFLEDFWLRRDPSPGTAQNEFKDGYIQRLVEAQANFSVGTTEGWKTDRGRVLLTYGSPNDIERYPPSTDRKAYEVWNYNDLDGGAQFYFVDTFGNTNYQLIHSTYREEISSPDWQTYLYK